MSVSKQLEKLSRGEKLREDELGGVEEHLYKENPMEVEVTLSVGETKRKVIVSPPLANLLRIRGENLNNLRISRYDDLDACVYVGVEEDESLQPHQIKLTYPEAHALLYDEEVERIEHLRLVLGECSKVFKDLQLSSSSMNLTEFDELFGMAFKYDYLSREEKMEVIKRIDNELEPAARTLYKVYPSIENEDLKDRIERFFWYTFYLAILTVGYNTPPGVPNARIYKGLKAKKIAIHPIYTIDSRWHKPPTYVELCVVHPILDESFFENVRVTKRLSLPLRYVGVSPKLIESFGIPVPEQRDFYLNYAFEYLPEEIDPQTMKFDINV